MMIIFYSFPDESRTSPKKVKFETASHDDDDGGGVLATANQIVKNVPAPALTALGAARSENYGFLKPAGLDRPDPNPNSSEATDIVCGKCVNCSRKPCQECSFCKRGEASGCIDR